MSVDELERGFREALVAVFAAGPTARRREIRRRVWQKPSWRRS
jgi:hypothetical protein